jgi:hypothetical protein
VTAFPSSAIASFADERLIMSDTTQRTISVLDFRRRRMAVQWNVANGAWTSHEEAPALVHGIALIRPARDNVCLYGHAGTLILQIGAEHHVLADTGAVHTGAVHTDPGILVKCSRIALSLGFRREIAVTSAGGAALFTHQYWIGSGPDFFKLLADKTAAAEWRAASALSWSDGVSSTQLRESWAR